MRKLLLVTAIITSMAAAIAISGVIWLERSSGSCWKNEAESAFTNYERYKNISEVSSVVATNGIEILSKEAGYIEIVESDPNACSLGSNGQTIVKIYFGNDNKIIMIRVYKNYITSNPDYQMELIGERVY